MLNSIINNLDQQDRDRILPYMKPVRLPRMFIMAEPNEQADLSYFLESGIGSVVGVSPAGSETEVAIFGREGMSPPNSLFEDNQAPFKVFIQVEGHGHSIENEILFDLLAASRSFRRVLSRYAQTLFVQTAYTSLSNASHSIEKRLARWLLMVHDRSDDASLPITHDFLSAMLNVRRQSVTDSLHVLEGENFISNTRGLVTIRNRERLQAFAGDAYGVAEAEFERLIGRMR